MNLLRHILLTAAFLAIPAAPASAQIAPLLRSLLGTKEPVEAVPNIDFSGKKVSLELDNQPLSEAFQKIREQTGMQFSLTPNANANPNAAAAPADSAKVSLSVKDKPMWEVVRALLEQTGQSQPMSFFMQDPSSQGRYGISGYVYNSGPFLLYSSRVSHVADYTQPADKVESLQLQLQLMCDPSVHVNTIPQQIKPTRAVDDNGNSMVPSRPMIESRANYGGSSGVYGIPVTVLLEYPTAGPGKKLTNLDGSFSASFLNTQNVEVPVGTPVTKNFSTFSAYIEVTTDPARVTAAGGSPAIAGAHGAPAGAAAPQYTFVILRFTRANPNTPLIGNDPYTIASQGNAQPQLLDAQGNQWRINSRSTSSPDSNTRIWFCRYQNIASGPQTPGPAAKAVIQIPISSKDTTISFHFENIPLP